MAEQQHPNAPDTEGPPDEQERAAGTAGSRQGDETARQRERDRQNNDDPSRAPESGDRK